MFKWLQNVFLLAAFALVLQTSAVAMYTGTFEPKTAYTGRYGIGQVGPDLVGQKTGALGQEAGGIGGLQAIFSTSNGVTTVYIPTIDRNGNITKLINATTHQVDANYEYSPYGVLVAETGPAKYACPLRFMSKYYDKETGLYYYGYRFYNPTTCKWLSNDPLQERGGYPLNLTFNGDPINNYDPLGLSVKGEAIGYVVRRVAGRLVKVSTIISEKQAARLWLNGADILFVKMSKEEVKLFASKVIQKSRLLYHKGHDLWKSLPDGTRKYVGKGLRHFQDDLKPGQHMFFTGRTLTLPFLIAGVVGLAESGNANDSVKAGGYEISVDGIYNNPYPGPSVAHYLTVSKYVGDDSILSCLDWINPGDLVAVGGDIGREISRQMSKALIGVALTVSENGKPVLTITFDNQSGDIKKIALWQCGELVQTIEGENLNTYLASEGNELTDDCGADNGVISQAVDILARVTEANANFPK